ncbi:MAG: hypothetical protein HRT35_11790 [Algicola sp.]|nr:hypothetical protein [Algicola sp.]
MKRAKLLMAALVCCFCFDAIAKDTFVLARHKNSPSLDPCYEVVTQAYRALRINLRVNEYPGRRSLQLANSGKVDGDLCRITQVAESYQNLLPVTPFIMSMSIVAITRKGVADINSLVDLGGRSVGSERGMQAVELVVRDRKIHYENDGIDLIRLLDTGFIDVVLLTKGDIELLKNKGLLAQVKVHPKWLYQVKMFHYIHKKHRLLIPALSQQITKAMKGMQGLNR